MRGCSSFGLDNIIYRKSSRIIIEGHLGRELTPDEDVHHIDGDPANNSIENLEVLSHAEHSSTPWQNQKEYERRSKAMSIASRNYWDNLSSEERLERTRKRSEGVTRWWRERHGY